MKHSQNDRTTEIENRLEFARGEGWGKEEGGTEGSRAWREQSCILTEMVVTGAPRWHSQLSGRLLVSAQVLTSGL